MMGRGRQLEVPRRAVPPPSRVEYLPSDEGEESEISERDSVFTENTNQVIIFMCIIIWNFFYLWHFNNMDLIK
jgi:hypothetical protein